MPTNRRRIGHKIAPRITPEAIVAWQSGDYWALHRDLGLSVWQMPDWDRDPPGADPRPASLRHRFPVPDPAKLKVVLTELAGPPPKRWRYKRPE